MSVFLPPLFAASAAPTTSIALAALLMLSPASRADTGSGDSIPPPVFAAKPATLSCQFDLKCILGAPCEPVSLPGELRIDDSGIFGMDASLRLGGEKILLTPPLIEGGDWVNAPFTVLDGGSPLHDANTKSGWLVTRAASGETVYTLHSLDEPRAVSWRGFCSETVS